MIDTELEYLSISVGWHARYRVRHELDADFALRQARPGLVFPTVDAIPRSFIEVVCQQVSPNGARSPPGRRASCAVEKELISTKGSVIVCHNHFPRSHVSRQWRVRE